MLIYLFHPHISNCKQFHKAKIINLRETSVFKSVADGFSLTTYCKANIVQFPLLTKNNYRYIMALVNMCQKTPVMVFGAKVQ